MSAQAQAILEQALSADERAHLADALQRSLESLPMSAATYDDLSNFTLVKTDDPEVRARRHMILTRFLEVLPEAREKLIQGAGWRKHARACDEC